MELATETTTAGLPNHSAQQTQLFSWAVSAIRPLVAVYPRQQLLNWQDKLRFSSSALPNTHVETPYMWLRSTSSCQPQLDKRMHVIRDTKKSVAGRGTTSQAATSGSKLVEVVGGRYGRALAPTRRGARPPEILTHVDQSMRPPGRGVVLGGRVRARSTWTCPFLAHTHPRYSPAYSRNFRVGWWGPETIDL